MIARLLSSTELLQQRANCSTIYRQARKVCGRCSADEQIWIQRPRCAPPATICRRWRKFPLDRPSGEIRISWQTARSFLLDLPRLSAKAVPSPRRESCSSRHASVLRFVSLAFPSFHYSFSERIALAWSRLVWATRAKLLTSSCVLNVFSIPVAQKLQTILFPTYDSGFAST